MPTYEYECDACQHAFEEFQSFSEKVLKNVRSVRSQNSEGYLAQALLFFSKVQAFTKPITAANPTKVPQVLIKKALPNPSLLLKRLYPNSNTID